MKNYRKYLVPFILIILIAVGISKFNIESVSRHENVNKAEMKGAEATAGESEKQPKTVRSLMKFQIIKRKKMTSPIKTVKRAIKITILI